jgi:serine/threonine protein kinase
MVLSGLYEISDIQLGSGAFGTVYVGVKKDVQEKVAIKVIHKATHGVDLAAVTTEAQILKSLNHPNIVKVYDLFEDSATYYICMELITGGELFDRVVLKQFYNEKDARDLSLVLLRAVKHCHDNHIIHRDIKAENLLLVSEQDDATVKLVDFGLSIRAEGFVVNGQYGTYEYMAPEIWGGKTMYGSPVDMWSVGVLVYILLAGYQPFQEESRQQLKHKILTASYEFHDVYWKNISDEAKDFVTKLLTVDMHKRLTAEQALQHPWVRNTPTTLFTTIKSMPLP